MRINCAFRKKIMHKNYVKKEHVMKAYHRKRMIVILSILIVGSSIWRFVSLNERYPDPGVVVYKEKDKIKGGDIEISVSSSNLVSMEEMLELLSDHKDEMIYEDETSMPQTERKVLLVQINIKNTSSTEQTTSLVRFMAQAGAWANGMDLGAYCALNGVEKTNIQLKPKEQRSMMMPFYLYESQFAGDEFHKVDRRKFSLVLSVYPVKNIIELF